jgi:hypothetical protein
LRCAVEKTEGRARDSEVGVGGKCLGNRLQSGHLDFGVTVEKEEQVTRRPGHAVVDSRRESYVLRQAGNGVHRVFPLREVSGVVGARVVDDDDFIGLRVTRPQCGETAKGELAGVVRRDDYREAQVIFHGLLPWYQRLVLLFWPRGTIR